MTSEEDPVPWRISSLGLHSFASSILVYSFGAVASVLIARALGPYGRGQYFLPVTLITVAHWLAVMGIPQAQLHLWSRKAGTRDAFVTSSVLLAAIITAAGGGLAWTAYMLGQSGWFQGVSPRLVLIVLPAIFFLAHSQFQMALLTYIGQLPYTNLARVVGALVQSIGTVLLFVTDRLTVPWVLVLFVASVLAPWGVMQSRMDQVGHWSRPLPLRLVSSHLGLGARFGPGALFQYLNLRIDVFFVSRFLGITAVGIYSIAVIFSELVWLATQAVTASIGERQANAEPDEAVDVTERAIRMNIALSLIIGLCIGALAPMVIPLLYGGAFRSAVPVVWILLIASAAMSVWRPCMPMIVRFASRRTLTVMGLGAATMNVGFNVILIPRLGLTGAALASVISYGSGAVFSLVVLTQLGFLSKGSLIPGKSELKSLLTLVATPRPPAVK